MSTSDRRRPAALRARDVLTGDLATVPDTASMSEARSLMRHLQVHHLPVLGPAGLVGLLHEPALGDVDGPVLDHVIRDVPQALLKDGSAHLEALLATSACGAVVVVDEARHLVGVITTDDLSGAVARSA